MSRSLSRLVRLHVALGFLGLIVVAGCEKSPYDMAYVHGTVTFDGKPLSGGRIMFAPRAKQGEFNPGKPAFGRIGPDGTFALSTYGDEDGAIVGEHNVTIVNTTEDGSTESGVPKFNRISLPRVYKVVAGEDNQIDIELTRLDVAQFGR